MSRVRGSQIALIIQDPMTSLNPVFSIGNQVMEAVKIQQDIPKKSVLEMALDALRKLNIPAAGTRMQDYPHQMSGGIRERVVGGHQHLLSALSAHRRRAYHVARSNPFRPNI